jgi:enamine deaminase RidA (YjgF/YER057c/UK114 family)
MSYSDVVSVTVYLSDMDLFGKMNAVYATYFKDPKPVRATRFQTTASSFPNDVCHTL